MTAAEVVAALQYLHWWLRNLYYIKDKNGKIVIFSPNEEQEKFLNNLWYRNVVPEARQRGLATQCTRARRCSRSASACA